MAENEKVRMITIRDILISPYEIDVESRNIVLVKVGVNDKGETVRKGLGFYNNLWTVLNIILQFKAREITPDMDGRVVNLKEFLQHQRAIKNTLSTWIKFITGSSEFNKGEVPELSPRHLHEALADKKKKLKK